MSLTPVQRAESLLAKAVSILYAVYRASDFPENYIRSLAPLKIRERLHELRTLETPAYRADLRSRSTPAGADLQELCAEGFRRMLDFADRQLAEAVDALYEIDARFAERYLESAAQKHMAACLRWTRALETPAERAALVTEVNALRESVVLGPLDEEQVTALPGAGLLRRGVGERRKPGERHLPRSISWRYPQLFQGDLRQLRRPAATRWRQPAAIARRSRSYPG
jgi:hypothetical protein